jgi:hypothetical protein
MNVFAFKIATVPDVELGKLLYDLHDLSDEDVMRVMRAKQREQAGAGDELALHMQRITAVSALYRNERTLKVWSLGEVRSSEKQIIRHFFAGIEKYIPTLVSWNGGCYDLPVMHYRALKHGISSKVYWDTGSHDESLPGQNYHGRFYSRHLDMRDILSGHNQPGLAPLDDIAVLLGLPATEVVSDPDVIDINLIRQRCEHDVLNTWLIYLHWLHMTAALDDTGLTSERQLVQESLLQENQPHLTEYLKRWNETSVSR